MGSGESTAIEPQDVVGEAFEEEEDASPIQVQYGPNIVGQLLGYDQRTRDLSQAAHTLYEAISKPSNQNRHKAQILVSDVHSRGMEEGRATVSLSEIERDMMDDVDYKVYLHKKTYGVRDINDVDKKFNLEEMDSVCDNFKKQIENCLAQKKNDNNALPYYDQLFLH
eukprot:CAMPEP_0201582050 /NCGR_PEP_ID=MMETSP0190_2-20130828/79401_1 /ASSEMBLY_ACC=CAM_ASM_000263 /TAXON_ID=37353 /ORGANISM="Rosalina sp." /LENGTH=166 /DNA_ID=CAMNT_0048021203 /DNA_START=21 /DNA_END=522 /DNA_ORIENTATION=+